MKRRDMKMTKVVEIVSKREDFPLKDEGYTVGKVEDGRYFFAWGPVYPFANDVPPQDIDDGESGISFYNNEDAALEKMMEALQAALETSNPINKKERIEKIFFELHGADTDWSHAADLFVAWCISKKFLCDSFDRFVEWIPEGQIDEVWTFWFGYDNIEKFAESWVVPEEVDDYVSYCRKHA